MIEIIKREEGAMSEKEDIRGWNMQVSYNDWGHLVVRVIHSNTPMADTLVVFDKSTSERIIEFAKRLRIDGIARLEEEVPF